MKKTKLIAIAALALTFGVTGCNNNPEPSPSPSPSVAAVKRIQIQAPANVVVGTQVNLDDYVTVDGGVGPKVYDVEVPAAQEGKVVVDGHMLTALVEGDISVNILAGGKSAKFGTSALSQLKADFAALTNGLRYEWALYEPTQQGLALSVVHREDYTLFSNWGDNGEYGGFLKAQNGNTYSYILNATTGEVEADPELMSDFALYYCNNAWALTPGDFEYVQETDETTGEVTEMLVLSKDIPSATQFSHIDTLIEYFMYTCAFTLNPAVYEFGDLIAKPVTLVNEDESTYKTFALSCEIFYVADGSSAGGVTYVIDTRKEVTEVPQVRNYIDEGNAPAAIDGTELLAHLDEMAAATSYQIDVEYGWFASASTAAAPATNPFIALGYAAYAAYMGTGSEKVTVDATGLKYEAHGSNYVGSVIDETTPFINGFKVDGTTVSNYTNEVEDSEGNVSYAETFTGGVVNNMTPEALKAGYTLAAIAGVADEDVVIVDKDETDPENVVWLVQAPTLVSAVLNATYSGFYADYLLQNGWTVDMRENVDFAISFTETSATYVISFTWEAGVVWVYEMEITGINSTTVTHPDFTAAA